MPETPADKRERLLSERDDKMLAFAQQGLTRDEIGERLGLEAYYVGKQLKALEKARGITLPPVTSQTQRPAYGLTSDSHYLRAQLGFQLGRLLDSGLHPVEVAELTGVSQKAQATQANPYPHDWTISQIERLARARGMSFNDFIVDLISKQKIGF